MDSFRRLMRAIRDFRSILWFVGIVFGGLLYVKNASAQVVPVHVTPMSLEITRATAGGGLEGIAVYKASAPTVGANDRFYTRGVAFSKQTVANGVRSRFALGPALAMAAAVTATGWVLDEITKDIWTVPPGDLQPEAPAVGSMVFTNNAVHCPSTCHTDWGITREAACAHHGGAYGWDGGRFWCNAGGEIQQSPLQQTMLDNPNDAFVQTPTPGVAATDDQLNSFISNNPAAWPEPFHWPAPVGSPAPHGQPRVMDPMPQQMTDIQSQFRTDTGLEPLPAGEAEPVPVPQPDAVGDPAPEAPGTTTNPTPQPVSVTFPAFCSWAATVCTALDWLTDDGPDAPTDAVLPEVNTPIVEQTFDSGLGPGSCPGEIAVSFEFSGTQSFGFSYQPLCDFAVMIKPLILLLGAIMSALIIAGVRMKNA